MYRDSHRDVPQKHQLRGFVRELDLQQAVRPRCVLVHIESRAVPLTMHLTFALPRRSRVIEFLIKIVDVSIYRDLRVRYKRARVLVP